MDAYATHLRMLVRAALRRSGPILELGCGDYSTPVLAEFARDRREKLTVLSADPEWSARYRAIADVRPVAAWESFESPSAWPRPDGAAGRWGLVLLDNEQLTRDRVRLLPALAIVARIVVVHDVDKMVDLDAWETVRALFYRIEVDHDLGPPWTAMLEAA